MNEEPENVSLNIDLAFEHIKPVYYEKVFDQLKADRDELLEALRHFTIRVESGFYQIENGTRTNETYKKFKTLISKHDLRSKNHSKNGKSARTI